MPSRPTEGEERDGVDLTIFTNKNWIILYIYIYIT